jgi:lipopolysaccharide/colanic/teichoic acid biosynthesis glycosyltransferase
MTTMPPPAGVDLAPSEVLLLEPGDARVPRVYAIVKRFFDVLASAALITVLSPILLAIAIAIKVDSKGPVFFRQERLGRNGRPFRIVKFRSMRTDNDDATHRAYVTSLIQGHADMQAGDNGKVYKLLNDDRITRVGRFLRRTSIDELPQLFNVLGGSMSLVGPRPPLAYEVAVYQPHHLRRLIAKPGMTGLWQVSGRNALDFEQMIDLDLQYVESRSFAKDLEILARTVPVVLGRSGG